jgi:hypothetical protein
MPNMYGEQSLRRTQAREARIEHDEDCRLGAPGSTRTGSNVLGDVRRCKHGRIQFWFQYVGIHWWQNLTPMYPYLSTRAWWTMRRYESQKTSD